MKNVNKQRKANKETERTENNSRKLMQLIYEQKRTK